jgi:hypothetical protein
MTSVSPTYSTFSTPVLSLAISHGAYALPMKRTLNRHEIGSQLPRPVLDRIRRYAQEGREPRAQYGTDSCMLLAVAMGQPSVVILRCTRREFTEIRSAALVEWTRAARVKTSWRRTR